MSDMLQQRSPQEDLRSSANVVAYLAGVCALTLEVFLHKHMGHRYVGGKVVAALIFVPVFGALCFPHHDQGPLMVFLGLFVLAALCARSEAQRLKSRGVRLHSRFNGWPRSLKLTASAEQEQRVKSIGEPLLVAVWGALIYCAFNQPLGAYLMVGAFSLGVTNGMYRMRVDRQVDELIDAGIEQEMMSQHFRQGRGDR